MTKRILLTLAGAAFALAACEKKATDGSQAAKADSTLAPVETKAANSEYKPAFAGQTRIGGIKSETNYEGKVLFSDLKNPWGITSLPDGRLLITEKAGTMRIAKPTGEVSAPITGIPAVNSDGQGGLLGIRVDPDFDKNRMVYWVFSDNQPKGTLTAVAKGKLSADEKTIEGAQVIYRATPAFPSTLHYGGRILIDKNDNLIVSTGERSDTISRPQAQHLNSALGKIVRITKDGKPAAGNPFEGKGDARPELYSLGHRNVQGLAFHPVTGDLWEVEFGPRGGDELNRIEPGKNYGWPTITYGIEYSGKKVGGAIQQKEGLEQPVYYWDPVVSPSGITFYGSDSIPEWKNNLFIGSLSGMHIVRLVIENNKVVGEERLLADENQRFRDVTEGKDGALYAVTDQGRLYRIFKK
ncbi:PQQ-dependent sugar dehydrogenase [Dyadobacter sandarakinus]|uniref:PQQ-dependent sugar dehydrogenase n=1 Tax=Dyadobacter sandarakinus TaxID=2747268 RepID=A0ABX7I5V2_9BACT|nr:PQQ-dependent sugar dehydrogenase [Dyadobacter sandarakinus]QRR01260.1 PQQ-dependent sugar dehydrogenase [Dyadobacter sandarakinus]